MRQGFLSSSRVMNQHRRSARERCLTIWLQDKSSVHDVPRVREHASRSAICICDLDLDSGREWVAYSDGSSKSGVGTNELEISQVRTGGGVGGCVPRVEGLLRVGGHPHCIGRGPLAGDIKLR